MIKYFDRTLGRVDLRVNGEFYASMAYRPMVEAAEKVSVYRLRHFMQWGTPQDLAEYEHWSGVFAGLSCAKYSYWRPARHAGAVVVPMAGLGQRFKDRGYTTPKPLLPVSGKPMVAQAVGDLPLAERTILIVRKDLPDLEALMGGGLDSQMRTRPEFLVLDGMTDGQARTAYRAVARLDPEQPVTIGACDNGMLYEASKLEALLADPQCDVVVWTMRGHPGAGRNPRQYGWVDERGGVVRGVSVKAPLGDPAQDAAIVGTFTFKRAGDYIAAAERMFAREATVNGEYYIDTLINDAVSLGLRCRIFDVDHYIGWGTPNDLLSFSYWQSCFDKWRSHVYSLGTDSRVSRAAIRELRECGKAGMRVIVADSAQRCSKDSK